MTILLQVDFEAMVYRGAIFFGSMHRPNCPHELHTPVYYWNFFKGEINPD